MEIQKQKTAEELAEEQNGKGQQEFQLKEELDYYKDLWENSAEMHVNVEPHGNIRNCNKALCERLGYEKDEIVGKPIFFVYHKDSLGDAKVAFDNFISKGIIKDTELFLKKKDGKKVPVLLNVTAKRDEKGNILYSRSSWQDITKLKESEEKYRFLLESITDGVVAIDKEWRYILVNEENAKMTGVPKEKMLNSRLTDLFPGVIKTEFFKTYKKVMETRKPATLVQEYTFEDGRKGCYENGVYPIPEGILVIATDVTERKKAEQAIKEREERLSQFINSSTASIHLFDSELNLIDANDIGIKMTGKSRKKVIGKNILDISPKVKGSGRYEKHIRVIKTGKPYEILEEFELPNGSKMYLDVKIFKVGDGLGIITTDLTKQHNTEQALKELNQTLEQRVEERTLDLEKVNMELEQYTKDLEKTITERKQVEEQFHTLFEQAGDALFLIGGPDGHFTDVNRRACKALGYTREELLTLGVADINPDLSLEKFSELFENLALHKPITVEAMNRRKSGSTFPVEIRSVRINIHGKKRILSMARDITERKKADQAIKDKEERLSQFINSSTAAIHLFDSKLNLIDANDIGIKMTCRNRKEVIGKNILHIAPKVKKSGRYNSYVEVIKTGIPNRMLGEFELLDGQKMYLDIKAFKVGDGLGLITTNLTEKYKVEKELKRYAKDIETANKELQEFAYVAAHDLKAPLINLTALADMIDSETIADEEGKELFGKLKNSIGQLHNTVFALNDVLAFKTTLKDKKERMNFEELFSGIKESITEQLEASKANIKQDFSQCPEIDYPPLHLRSVMQNLLTNALKYKHPDRALKIKVKTTESNKRVCLTVKDNGLGFDAKKYGAKLTGLFTRLHTHVEGKGVGMYIVNSIVDSHGGKIEIKSKPDKGALFRIYLNEGK
ncbi:MAG: hypothetical protein COA57_06590 [Flavobacteriales bacterium]|nr:MAG: hypothetical protein COA57_06590 [Flavobacteriales bacterium]